jgi:hypothetical protein
MATLAQGYTKLQVNTGTVGSPVWADIPGVFNVGGTGLSPNRIDATDFDTTAGTKEYIAGPRDQNPLTFEMHYEQANTYQELLFTNEAANTSTGFRVKFGTSSPKGVVIYGVPSLTLASPVDGKVTYSGSVEPLGVQARGSAS